MDKLKRVVAIAMVSMVLTYLPSFAAEEQSKDIKPAESPIKAEQRPQTKGILTSDELFWGSSAATSVFEKVSKSVVIVEALSSAGKVQGSGVVYDNNRWFGPVPDAVFLKLSLIDIAGNKFSRVVTNAHVVKNASNISVLHGDKRYRAELSYIDDEFDLALLIVFGILPVSPPSSGVRLKVGERVFAIGSPLGLENTISEGIISGKRQQNDVLLLQTTAAVSPGSSGGGLFDVEGCFIGVTTFKLVGGENLNFAIDANRAFEIDSAQDAAMTLLRCKWPEHFSKDKIDALTDWLLKAPAENSEKLYTTIKRAKFNEVCKDHIQILERFSKDQVNKIPKPRNEPKIVRLVCSLTNSKGDRSDDIFELDYVNRTVNGHSALFTDNGVEWTEIGGDTEFHIFLNRYSGSVQIGTKNFPSLLSGQCSPAVERKF